MLINANFNNIAIVPSVSYGMASILNNIDGKENGNIITTENEFPGICYSAKKWANNNFNNLKKV